jgi:hypothetical protein
MIFLILLAEKCFVFGVKADNLVGEFPELEIASVKVTRPYESQSPSQAINTDLMSNYDEIGSWLVNITDF